MCLYNEILATGLCEAKVTEPARRAKVRREIDK